MSIKKNDLSDIDLDFIKFFKTNSKNKLNYVITYKNNKITLNIKKITIPFGVEKYNNQSILNIEITPNNSNSHYNIYQNIKRLENKIRDLSEDKFCSNELKNDIIDKEYHKNIKKRENSYLIRTYLFGSPKIFRNIDGFEVDLSLENIKKTISNVELELGILWINQEEYGLLWYIKKIEVLHDI